MIGATRRCAMAAIVAFVCLWPFVHLFLVAHYRVDPWELFGWAMYSRPAARVQIRVDVERLGETKQLRAMGAIGDRIVGFARRRTAIGELASPEGLVQAVFEDDPSVEAVEIVLREVALDLDSALLVTSDEVLRFERASQVAE